MIAFADRSAVAVIGKENVGKSQLVASLTGAAARSANFRGSTVGCEVYRGAGRCWVDTPGIVRHSDSATTRAALGRLHEWPRTTAVWRDARATLGQFFRQAAPVFFAITLIASLLDWLGIVRVLSGALGPLMAWFGLPAEAVMAVVLASIRKDGILLLAEPGLVATLSPVQLLVGVYLAGVLLPCLATVLVIAREQGWRFASLLLARQGAAAVLFSLLLAWGGRAGGFRVDP